MVAIRPVCYYQRTQTAKEPTGQALLDAMTLQVRGSSRPLIAFALALILLWASGCRSFLASTITGEEEVVGRQLANQGVEAMERREWERAEGLLERAVQACPDDADTRRYLADVYWRRDEPQKAMQQMQTAVKLDPDNPWLHARLAYFYLEQGQLALAWSSVQVTLDLDPKSAEAWAMRARILDRRGYPDRALADYHRALGYAQEDRQILLETAELYRRMDRPGPALAMLQNLSDSYNPGEEPREVLYLMGLAQMALDRHADGAKTLQFAADRGPPSAEILYRLAHAQWLAGHAGEARMNAARAGNLDPTHKPTQQLLAVMNPAYASPAVTVVRPLPPDAATLQ